jgi:hypothetical protein
MVNSVGNNPNSYSGIGIYCNNIDISKLSKEERDKYLEKMPNVTYSGMGPSYPPGYYINNYANNTVKKRVTVLTDDYIKQLDQFLQSDDTSLREYAASEVIKRLDEDKTRYNDEGLNALVNKMILDPYDHKVRERGLIALDSQLASGNEETKQILELLKTDPNLLDRDRGIIDTALLQMNAQTKIINAPVTSGGNTTSC